MENSNELCPSYMCKSGAKLYGIINSNGNTDYLKSPITINESFVNEAKKGRDPEKRFRFAGSCIKSGCTQWSEINNECGLIDKMILTLNNSPSGSLKDCSIRLKCRWYSQKGEIACAQCNELVRSIETEIIKNS
ncbi:hypothetical protein [Spirosoma areae]